MVWTQVLLLVCVWTLTIRGTNIMLNKPVVQSSTWSSYYIPSHANDGNKDNLVSHTLHEQDPYWQGDLLGFYIVQNVSVTTDSGIQAHHLKNASIGVSVYDVTCPHTEVTKCGQWPDEYLPGQTLMYDCSNAGPVRFIRIWRDDVYDGLAISEVEVEGEPTNLQVTGTLYDKVESQTVSTPITSLTVTNAADCSTECFTAQSCFGFSYSPSLQPNCLLATNTTMTSDVMWDSYEIRECFVRPVCNVLE